MEYEYAEYRGRVAKFSWANQNDAAWTTGSIGRIGLHSSILYIYFLKFTSRTVAMFDIVGR